MASALKAIQKPVQLEMKEFENKFRDSMKSNVLLLDKITRYIVKRKGKQMRPLFVFLSAGACGGITEATYRGASLIELLHTATLVHDDVVDDAHQRRGFFSINAIWKNKIAVLVGDFLLSRGLLLSVKNKDFALLQIVSEAVKEMSEGELLQIEKVKKLDIDQKVYFEIIRQKTASLIKSCCQVGAESSGASAEIVEKMGKFGEYVGMAFQIKDDLFDYGNTSIGKPTGIDIKEKKLTLPLIYALAEGTSSEKIHIKRLIKKNKKNKQLIKEIIDYVKEKGGIDYAIKVMENYHQKANELLATLPQSEYQTALKELVTYTIDRNK